MTQGNLLPVMLYKTILISTKRIVFYIIRAYFLFQVLSDGLRHIFTKPLDCSRAV